MLAVRSPNSHAAPTPGGGHAAGGDELVELELATPGT